MTLRGCVREGERTCQREQAGGAPALGPAPSATDPKEWLMSKEGRERICKVSKENSAICLHHERQGKADLDWVDQKHEIPEKNKQLPSG